MQDRMEFSIYTPTGWTHSESLPLFVFLHGAGDGPDCFDEAQVGQHLDTEMEAGRTPRAVIVVPRGDFGFWENWADGSYRYRDWVLRSLVPAIAAEYGTRPCPEGCHLVGISMGGHGALRFAVLEPGRFASVTAISAPILDTDDALAFVNNGWLRWIIPTQRIWGVEDRESIERDDPFRRFSDPDDLGEMRLMVAWGDEDHAHIIETNERFEQHLSERGIPHEVLVFPGRHEWRAWTPTLGKVLALQLASGS
jgi:enterochelin esterase-like enzyme